ncbi:MAG: PaaI family thioesterase [Actinomycetia bacterium]|nr:PaaI family thioesterase [Actinomycetes bacterium]
MSDPLDISAKDINDHFFEVYPAAAETGVRCDAVSDGSAVARWIFDETQLRPGRYISGPTQFMLADTALWFAVFSVIGMESMAVTSEMSIRFLRPAQNRDLLAEATIDSVSTRRIVGTIRLWIDGSPDRPVAVAQGSYARPGRKS